ncbi:AAA family ATPase [Photobacterium nomapromontoriensis]|uniref:AAA family ATPase n=1 Tax=Photobacterium nomapromontoriensis TaxID=2910237 RepID=UPI003D0A99FA
MKAINTGAGPQSSSLNAPKGCTLIYQTAECLSLVKEITLFEGWIEPTVIKEALHTQKIDSNILNDVVVLELNQSKNVVDDARYFASQVPPHKGVIIIGKEDAISTLRSLKEMGFYYVLWPVNKQELTEFITHVNNNQQNFSGVSKQRKAKSVAVVGSKGGVGTTLICAELAAILSAQGADTILVDHQYTDSDIDVMLGIKSFQKYNMTDMTSPVNELDDESAMLFLTDVKANLRILALEGDVSDSEILSLSQALCKRLSRNTNFIIEDYSGSTCFRIDPQLLVDRNDVVIIVIEPSVASVRNARNLIEKINNLHMSEGQMVRTISVLNCHRPSNAFALTRKEVELYLEAPIDIDVAFNKQLSRIIIEGKRAYQQDKAMETVFDSLARLINGKANESKSSLNWLKKVFKR